MCSIHGLMQRSRIPTLAYLISEKSLHMTTTVHKMFSATPAIYRTCPEELVIGQLDVVLLTHEVSDRKQE